MDKIDWIMVALPLLLLFGVALYTRRYMKGVADFLSGGRMAGRYLLAVAKSEMGAGAASFAAMFEIISHSGFVMTWWGWMSAPLGIVLGISGWVVYRFRETRALTLAQYFEIRYSKSFRIFAGFLSFGAGLVNFGIIPAVGSRFLAYSIGLPKSFLFHGLEIPTYIPLMAVLLTITLLLALSGGLITLMITNCLEGMISQVLFLVIIVAMLSMFKWADISQVMSNQPPGQSLLNPFDAIGVKDFNIWLCLIGLWGTVYRTMAWQNQSAYGTAAITPHESRMSGIMSNWRNMGNMAVITLLAVCAMTFLGHPQYSAQAEGVRAEIAQIPQAQIQQQMTVPVTLAHMLPTGVKGALCIILMMGAFGGDGTHLLSWGSIFIQDVVLPFRKKPLSPEAHIRVLRWAMVGVAVFAFIFGCLFRQTEYVAMWWMVTESIYVAGAGAAIIGGLYWKKGSTAGAWSGMLTGSGLIVGGILARQFYGNHFPLNGAQISFYGSIAATLAYIVVSLMTCKRDFNLDQMLHRGKYAIMQDKAFETKSEAHVKWGKWIGFDQNFTLGDKWLAGGLFGWSMFWFVVLVIGTIWNYIAPWPIAVWSHFWYVVAIGLPILFALVASVWFTWGGILDMRKLFARLNNERVDVLDNGMVLNQQSLSESPTKSTPAPASER